MVAAGKSKNFGRSRHTEPYRVVTDNTWPRTPDSAHNARYFEDYNKALLGYMHSVMNQVFEQTFMERVTFECRCEATGTYSPMFESYQRHTVESYGLEA